mgnify:CR=1 FL=1
MEYIEIIIAFGLGLYIGFKVQDVIMKATFGRMLEEAGVTGKDLNKLIAHWKPQMDPEDSSADDLEEIRIKIERHSDTLYAFRKDNDQFLGQGATREELIERLGEKFTNVRLLVNKEDGAEFIGGHVKV